MPSTYSPLKIELMATGENSGTWGNVTNINLGTALEEAITGSADVTFASADVTLTLTDTNATQAARNLRLNLTGTAGASPRNLIVPAIEKLYLVNNGLLQTITVKNSTGTGIAVPAGTTMFVYNNGTNVVDAITYASSITTAGDLTLSGGTINGVLYLNSSKVATSGSALTFDGSRLGIYTGADSSVDFTGLRMTNGGENGTNLDFYNAFGPLAQIKGTKLGTGSSADEGILTFSTATNSVLSEKMRIDSSGNLGLGVTPSAWGSDTRAIQVYTRTSLSDLQSTTQLTNNGRWNGSSWVYIETAAAGNYFINGGSHIWRTAPSGTAGNAITWTQAMTLDASGNLGVGTTSPGTRLHVKGTYNLGQLRVDSDSGVRYTGLTILNNGTNKYQIYHDNDIGVVDHYLPSGADYFRFYTNATLRLTLDSSGNLGLGVTPSAWATTAGGAFQNGGNGAIFSRGVDEVWLSQNAYYDGSYKYINTRASSSYHQANGGHYLYSAASGTANNVITWTPVFGVEKAKSLSLEGAVPQTGTGITFPATQSASSNANTLDDYEEGTWTPTDGSGANLSFTVGEANYVKIGRLVIAYAQVLYPSTASGASANIAGWPFTGLVTAGTFNQGGIINFSDYGSGLTMLGANNGVSSAIFNANTPLTNSNLSTKNIRFTLVYQTL